MSGIYTGIGSRTTPEDILYLMTKLAGKLAIEGWILRSGGADGADNAFEMGALNRSGKVEIYLPWMGFNKRGTNLTYTEGQGYFNNPTKEAFDMAYSVLGEQHWSRLSEGAKKLHARNAHQVMGYDLETPTNFIVCWTQRTTWPWSGGTATALLIASKYGNGIPIVNMNTPEGVKRVEDYLDR